MLEYSRPAIYKRRSLLFLGILLAGGSYWQFADSKLPNEAPNSSGGYQSDPAISELLKDFDSKNLEEKKRLLTQFRASAKATGRARSKSAYILASVLKKGGSSDELKEAIPCFEEAAKLDPLRDRSNWHIVECANTLGNEPLLRDKLNDMLQKTKVPEQRAQIQYSLAQSYLRGNELERANDTFQKVVSETPYSQFATGATYYLGQAALQDKNTKEALRLWRQYLSKSPDGRFAQDIIKAMKAECPDEIQGSDHLLFAEAYFEGGRLANALAEWKASGTEPNWYKQGICTIKQPGRRRDGEELLIAGMKKHPTDKEIPDAAKYLARIGTRAEAISVWQTVLENCPTYGDYALFNLASRAEGQEAIDYYAELISKYPDSEFAPETSWWLVWDKIKNDQYTPAMRDLKTGAEKFKTARSGPRFSFWLGKLHEKLRQFDAARAAYQETITKHGNHYYGWRARGRLNALAGKGDPGWSTDTSKHLAIYNSLLSKGNWKYPETPQLVSYERIAREDNPTVACLAELHQWSECLEQMPRGRLPELRSICLANLNLNMESINTMAKELQGTPDKSPKWKLSYPLLHADLIKKEATEKSVDPLLAQGLIREESRYNVMAISSSNAIGLMQLLPGTAMGVAKKLGVSIKSKDDIHKPHNNIKFGIDYIAYTLKRADGNAMLAVASYNGGPNAVAGWKKKYSLDDPDTFVENVPFNETRDYIRKVFGSYWNYNAIYASQEKG